MISVLLFIHLKYNNMKKKLTQEQRDSLAVLYPQMFNVGEVYQGVIVDITEKELIVEFNGGAEGTILLADYINIPIFMVGTEVEVKIAAIAKNNTVILTFPSRYRKAHGIIPRSYDGIVLQSSKTSIAIFIPELKKAGLRKPDKLQTRYQIMKQGQRVKCYLRNVDGNLIIYKISAIIRDGREIPTFDEELIDLAVAAGSEKEQGEFLLGYIYEAVVKDNGIFINGTEKNVFSDDSENFYAIGDLLEVRITFINPISHEIRIDVISVLKHRNEKVIETPMETLKVLETDYQVFEEALATGSAKTFNDYELGKLYKAKVLYAEEDEKVSFLDGTNALIVSNPKGFLMGSNVWARIVKIDVSRKFCQDIPIEVRLEEAAKN